MKLNKAFTLIELLVVIAIIAILAAILFPVFAQAKLAAKKSADLSNCKQIGLGVLLYINDSDDTYPMSVYDTQSPYLVPGSGDIVATVYDAIMPYMKSPQLLVSPTNPPGIDFASPAPTLSVLTSVGLRGYGTFTHASYAPNFALFEDPSLFLATQFVDPSLAGLTLSVVNASSLSSPVETVAFYTATYATSKTPIPTGYSTWCQNHWPTPKDAFSTSNFPGDTKVMSGINITFADGHAKFKEQSAAFTATSTSGCLDEQAPCPTYHMPCDLTGLPDSRGNTWGN